MQFQIPPQLGQVQGRVAQLWGTRPQFVKDNPLLVAAGGLGLIGANQALGNPIGGMFGGDPEIAMTSTLPQEVPMSVDGAAPPPLRELLMRGTPKTALAQQYVLNDEDKARALSNLKRKIATDLVTIHALKGAETE